MHLDLGRARVAFRRHVLHAFRGSDGSLQGSRHEPLHRACAGAGVDGANEDDAFLDLGKLPQRQLRARLKPEQKHDRPQHDRDHGPLDEHVGEAHG